MSGPKLGYLDASAFIKLIASEPESLALEAELRRWPFTVASDLLEVEARRFGNRYGGAAPMLIEAALRRITLIPVCAEIRKLAASAPPPELRTLDAIHLATALALGAQMGCFFAYDRRLADAVEANGLKVRAPR